MYFHYTNLILKLIYISLEDLPKVFGQRMGEQLVRLSKCGIEQHVRCRCDREQLTVRKKRLQLSTVLQVQVLQLSEAFGQQTGGQLVRFLKYTRASLRYWMGSNNLQEETSG